MSIVHSSTHLRQRSRLDRRLFIGGSDARIIMGSDEAALIRLWREKRGEAEPEDLSGNLIVQLGRPPRTSTAPGTSAIPAGRSVTCSAASSTRPSPGWRQPSTGLWRAPRPCSRPSSCCPGHSPRRRRPKSTWPSSSTTCGSPICGARCCRSSPAAANGWRSPSPWTRSISAYLVQAEKKFWRCVQSGEPPHLINAEPPRPRIEAIRIVDMSSSNSWAEFAGLFRNTREAFLDHERAKGELKALMPEDAKEAIGHGVRAKRSKSGAVSFDVLATTEATHAPIQ